MGDVNVSTETSMVTSPVNVSLLRADITTISAEHSTLTASVTTLELITRTSPADSTTISGDDFNSPETYDYNYSYYEYEYDNYMYPGYSFERPVYLFIWEILVIFTFIVNVIVISVLLRRKMRNATNMILAAIAISDSLTGLVTLPTYIMVYQKYDPLPEYGDYPTNSLTSLNQSYLAYDQEYGDLKSSIELPNISDSVYHDINTQSPINGYILTKSLCRRFMISKYFLSKSFHAVSIFLTLLLGIQRYVSVAFPFKSQNLFCVKKTIIACAVIFFLSPVLHSYHL